MSDLLESVDKAETILILAIVGVGAYLLYNAWGDISDWLDRLTGASEENDYTNAAQQTLQHPVSTIGSILGFGQGSSGGQSDLPSDVSSVGYMKIGASGQHWSCTGPRGASNDVCMPVRVDANGNATVTGAGVLAVNAN
jgi:hypothetical protein